MAEILTSALEKDNSNPVSPRAYYRKAQPIFTPGQFLRRAIAPG